ncbi:MAG: hypothetical protein U0800_17895 [Isosphaeraceae bacterium]
MPWWDRLQRALFAALAVGLAWGIRGDFGHVIGAMYPGAVLALALAYTSGRASLFVRMPVLAALSAGAIGAGGTMSYGILHGYAQSDTVLNYGYGFLTLFLQGGAWGTFAGGLIGLMLDRRPMATGDWLGLLGSVFVGGWMIAFAVISLLGFHINPPRNDTSIAFIAAALCQFAWLASHRRTTGLRGALLGFLGFGLGMAAGRMLGNLANVLQEAGHFAINHWNVMEVSCGFIGGGIFCAGMVDAADPELSEEEPADTKLASSLGIVMVLAMIPLWHRLARIERPSAKLAEWSEALAGYGYENPEALAGRILGGIHGVCALGFVGAAIWLLIHFRRWRWASAFPVIWSSLTMLLYQNFNALYFLYPSESGRINMHSVFWGMFGLMSAHVAFVRHRPADSAAHGRAPWLRWTLAAAIGLSLLILLSGLINGEQTMRSANTRWPAWSWKDGPFPGR